MVSMPHIPAWKRLGLKLKHEAAGQGNASTNGADGAEHGEARHEAIESRSGMPQDGLPRQSKKRRLDTEVDGDEAPRKKADTAHVKSVEEVETPRPAKKRLKSVSFTPETKEHDGTSSPEVVEVWEASPDSKEVVTRSISTPREDSGPSYSGDTHANVSSKSKSKSKPRTRKPKIHLAQHSQANGVKQPKNAQKEQTSSLDYLTQFHSSRSSWKFNKAKQTHLMRDLFDLDKVPWSYSDALDCYLSGLKGEGLRARLYSEAQSIIALDERTLSDAPMEDKESSPDTAEKLSRGGLYGLFNRATFEGPNGDERKQAYKDAVAQYKKEGKEKRLREEEWELLKEPQQKKRLLTRRRADRVVWSVGPPTDSRPDAERAFVSDGEGGIKIRPGVIETKVLEKGPQANGKPKRKRIRKRRTGVPDDDSSSTESTTSDDDSDKERDLKRTKSSSATAAKVNGVSKKRTPSTGTCDFSECSLYYGTNTMKMRSQSELPAMSRAQTPRLSQGQETVPQAQNQIQALTRTRRRPLDPHKGVLVVMGAKAKAKTAVAVEVKAGAQATRTRA